MKNIVVSNIYGKYNLGDQAIRNSALKMLSEVYPKSNFHLLCESTKNFPVKIPRNITAKLHYAPYGFAMDTEGQAKPLLKKLYLLTDILLTSLSFAFTGKFNHKYIPTKGFYSYINLIRTADVVILMGGGYLVTKHSIKDYFGVLLNVLPLIVAKIFRKKIVVLPISFGPFASKIHYSILGNALKNTKLFCRDKISLKFAKKYNKQAKYLPDLALYEWRTYAK